MNLTRIVKESILFFGGTILHNHKSKILFYHDVGDGFQALDTTVNMSTPMHLFEAHINLIEAEKYKVVPTISSAEGEVAIMFDDGFHGVWDNRSFFYEKQLKPTVFLAVDLIGKKGYLMPNEIMELQKHGFLFEGHSWSHVDLTTKTDLELIHELNESKDYLSDMLGKDVTELCLPRGFFSRKLIDKAFESGYKTIYCSVPGNYDEMVEGMRPRNLVQHSSPREAQLILRGGNTLLRSHYIKMHSKG